MCIFQAEINRAGTTFQRFRRLYDNLLQNRYKFDSSQWEKLQLIFQLTCNTAGFELLQKYFGDESEKEIYNPSINEFFVSPDDLSMPFNNSSVKQALFKSARNGNVIKMREMLASILQIFSSQGDEEEMVQKFGNFLLRTQDKVGKCILHAAVDGNCKIEHKNTYLLKIFMYICNCPLVQVSNVSSKSWNILTKSE